MIKTIIRVNTTVSIILIDCGNATLLNIGAIMTSYIG